MYLARAEFRNCQSLRNITMEFSDKLNCIIAPDNDGNSTGKSVFFKCLRTSIGASFFDADEIVHLISYGEDKATALFTLSDGSAGGFLAVPHKIIYLWKRGPGEPIEKLTEPHLEFLNKMSIVMDMKTKFVLNILDTDEMLFVNSREDTNYSSLKLVSDNDTLEDLIPAIEEKISDYRSYYTRSKNTNEDLHRKFNSLEKHDIPKLEQAVDYGESLIPLGYHIVKINETLAMFNTKDIIDLTDARSFIEIYNRLVVTGLEVHKIEPIKEINYEQYKIILAIYQHLFNMFESIRNLRGEKGPDIQKYKQVLKFYETLEIFQKHATEIKQVDEVNIDKQTNLINYYQHLEKMQKSLQNVLPSEEINFNRYKIFTTILDKMSGILEKLKELRKENNITEVTSLREELLAWADREVECPIKGKVFFAEEGCIRCDKLNEICS